MKTTIVYIHGYGSSPDSETAKAIKEAFSDEVFVCPHIDHSADPLDTYSTLCNLAFELLTKDAIIVGSSAGGFWADLIGSSFGIKTVLINPSLLPAINFRKYNLPKEYYDDYEFLQDLTKDITRHHIVAFVGENDDVVPVSHVQTHYKNPIVLKGEGHRLNDLYPVIDMIKSMVGNFPEYTDDKI